MTSSPISAACGWGHTIIAMAVPRTLAHHISA
jgi:hypothetical protein